MKKVLIVAAAAGLMTLAACQPTATNNTTVVENTTVIENVTDIDVVSNTTVDNAVAPVDANVTEGNTM
jgi:protein involved in sex pheromone biosynthesis